MKNTISFLVVLICLTFISKAQCKDYAYKQLSIEDTLYFGDGKYESVYPYVTSLAMGGYDGRKLRLSNDKGAVSLKEVSAARGKHQSEIHIDAFYGQIWTEQDTLLCRINSELEKIFVFDVSKNFKVDSFSGEITLKLISETYSKKQARTLVSTECKMNSVSITALPYLVSPEELSRFGIPRKPLQYLPTLRFVILLVRSSCTQIKIILLSVAITIALLISFKPAYCT